MKQEKLINDAIHLFPYSQVDPGEDIVLYGFGTVGHHYYSQIMANSYCNIKYIVDENWEKYALEYPVKPPDTLKNDTENKIVIALNKPSVQVLEKLKSFGISEEKVIFYDTVWGNPILLESANMVGVLYMSEAEAIEYYNEPII